ncbi:MAG: glycoside hydrolase family 27 protein [Acidobacteria bacterium]|nr:glycoside hydrolase family 27 protein [Acidobacteriota bacterium]
MRSKRRTNGIPTRIIALLATVALGLLPTLAPSRATALENGLARTPPMGWNPWNVFGCDIDERTMRATADLLVSSGLKDAGYRSLVLDDCWMARVRGADGNLMADPVRFPSGIRALADDVHARGLEIGIYEDAGLLTCQQFPGSYGHYQEDAALFASWGIDYLKFDWCFANVDNLPYACPREAGLSPEECRDRLWPADMSAGLSHPDAYARMRDALAATGRPIAFSICTWGAGKPWLWGRETGNLWRTTPDIEDSWESVMTILDQNAGLARYAGPGGWNDPDMLEVGNGGMTDTEYRAHFSLWAIMAAPLMAGNDLGAMTPETLGILTNAEVIAVDQDPLGAQGVRIRDDGDQEVWVKPLADGSRTIGLFNRDGAPARISVSAAEAGLPPAATYRARDLWAHTDATVEAEIAATVPAHGIALFRVSPP